MVERATTFLLCAASRWRTFQRVLAVRNELRDRIARARPTFDAVRTYRSFDAIRRQAAPWASAFSAELNAGEEVDAMTLWQLELRWVPQELHLADRNTVVSRTFHALHHHVDVTGYEWFYLNESGLAGFGQTSIPWENLGLCTTPTSETMSTATGRGARYEVLSQSVRPAGLEAHRAYDTRLAKVEAHHLRHARAAGRHPRSPRLCGSTGYHACGAVPVDVLAVVELRRCRGSDNLEFRRLHSSL